MAYFGSIFFANMGGGVVRIVFKTRLVDVSIFFVLSFFCSEAGQGRESEVRRGEVAVLLTSSFEGKPLNLIGGPWPINSPGPSLQTTPLYAIHEVFALSNESILIFHSQEMRMPLIGGPSSPNE